MVLASSTPGMILLCDPSGAVLQLVTDTLGQTQPALVGQSLPLLVDQASFQKALSFLVEVRTKGAAFNWELNLPLGEEIIPLHFTGIMRDDYLLVVAARINSSEERQLYDELVRINSEQINTLRETFKSTEARFRAVVDGFSDPILIIDENYLIRYVNTEFLTRFGYQRAEVMGTSFVEWLFPDEKSSFVGRLANPWLSSGTKFRVEHRLPRPDGTWEIVETTATPLSNLAGQPTIILHIRIITERKRAKEALRRSEQKFATAFHTSPDAINIRRLSDGLYLDANEGFTAITGYTREEVIGRSSLELNLWADPATRDQLVCRLQTGDEVINLEAEFWMKDGTRRTGLVSARLIELEEEVCILSITRDITQRKAAEEALRISEARYRLIADHLNDIIWQLDHELRFVYTSPAVEHILGYSVEEANQLSITDLLDAEGLVLMRQVISRKLDQPEERIDTIIEYKMRHKAGHMVEVEVVSAPIFDEHGQCRGFTGVTRDTRERKHAEAARIKLEEQLHQAQKMESIGRLSGGVAHDFNNLLVVINGYSELLLSRYLDPSSPLRKYVEEINRAGERAAALTQQLLAFSRKQVLQPKVINLNETVTHTEKMLHRLIGEDIDFITSLEPDLGEVKADPGQIEQVLMNLVVNARDAMPTGGRLTIETANVRLDDHFSQTHPETLNGPGVRLTVADTGCGMDRETLTRIFEPFFTTKEQGKGTGLGLATVYGIAKQSGGEITVDSQPGQGAAFSLYLPAHNTTTFPGSAIPLPEPVAQPGRETILLVEDEQTVRDFVRVALRNYGYTLLEVDHGYQALAMAQQKKSIDLLLTDVVMPDINGRELAERIMALHPRIKVLFMSGYTDDEVIRRGIQIAEVEFIAKPFSPVTLAAKVRVMMDK